MRRVIGFYGIWMTDQELKKLNKSELLQLLLDQSRELDRQAERIRELEEQLASRKLVMKQAGSLAEEALKLNRVFEAAQAAADQYLENIQAFAGQKDTEALQQDAEAVQKDSEAVQKDSEAVQKDSEAVQKDSEAGQRSFSYERRSSILEEFFREQTEADDDEDDYVEDVSDLIEAFGEDDTEDGSCE